MGCVFQHLVAKRLQVRLVSPPARSIVLIERSVEINKVIIKLSHNTEGVVRFSLIQSILEDVHTKTVEGSAIPLSLLPAAKT